MIKNRAKIKPKSEKEIVTNHKIFPHLVREGLLDFIWLPLLLLLLLPPTDHTPLTTLL